MPGGEDYVLRPCIAGMCRYESLVDGTLSLFDVVRMNDSLDVKNENDRRYMAAKEKK